MHDVAWICVRSENAQEQLARTSLSPGQTIATGWPNARNIVGRIMLRAFGHPVATCWVLLAQTWANITRSCRNSVAKRAQHVAPNNVGIKMYVALTWCDRLAEAFEFWLVILACPFWLFKWLVTVTVSINSEWNNLPRVATHGFSKFSKPNLPKIIVTSKVTWPSSFWKENQ